MMTTRSSRTVRGVIAALVATFVALFSHSVADGTAPSRVGVLLALAFAVPVCVALAGRRLSLVRLSVSVLSSQFAFHATMMLGNPDTIPAPRSGTVSAGHHQDASVPVLDLATSVAHTDHDTVMWGAHLLAAIVTIFALRQGERAFWSILARRRFETVRALLAGPSEPTPRRELPAFSSSARTRPRLVSLSVMRHRGPPVAAA
ncbi:hypothetical protein C5B95_15070 [Rathayibacter sp. AY1A7]|nr:hypothetical protein C5B95_15070 [Rathayibacter sp. AY1A7]